METQQPLSPEQAHSALTITAGLISAQVAIRAELRRSILPPEVPFA